MSERRGHPAGYPLDLARTSYSYLERPNEVLVAMLGDHVLSAHGQARVLDVGCGCGANARRVRRLWPRARLFGVEPNPQAVKLAAEPCDEVFSGMAGDWLASEHARRDAYDAVVLSDMLEHVADPVAFLRDLASAPALAQATWIVSVPNYAIWYNRLGTLFGRFEYQWSGLYDRTHLRFYTRRTIRRLLEYCGFDIFDDRATPGVAQATATLLRPLFERELEKGDHLALEDSRAFRVYQKLVQPIETRVCQLWPELLAFQIVLAAVNPRELGAQSR